MLPRPQSWHRSSVGGWAAIVAARAAAAGIAAVVLTVLLRQSALCADADPLSALIMRARTALGPGLGRVHAIHATGTVTIAGITGTFELWSNTTDGRRTERIEAGPFTGAQGYDGRTGWQEDAKGIVLAQNGPEASAETANEIFVTTDRLFAPAHGGADLSYLGMRTDAGKTYEAVSIKPSNGYPFEWWFDTATGLPARTIITMRGQTTTADLSDYRSVNGLMVPWKIVTTNDVGPPKVKSLTNVETDTPAVADHLEMPPSSAHDYSLTGSETSVPIELIDDQIFIDVMINGKGPFHFLFDSGARNFVDPTVAWAVGAKDMGSARVGGVGRRTSEMRFAQVDQVTIGGATLSNQYFSVAEIGPRQQYNPFRFTRRRETQGFIGYELPARFAVTVDYGAGRLILRQSDPHSAAPSGTTVPLTFDGTIANVKCGLSGVDAECMLDTGAATAIALTKPFVDDHPGVKPKWFSRVGYIASGLGGLSKGQVGPLASFRVGSQTLRNLDTIFSIDDKGMLADPLHAGLVGNPVWEHFILTLDYRNAALSLAPVTTPVRALHSW